MLTMSEIKKYRLEDFKGGWFIGDFEPSLIKSKDFEVSVKIHPKGEVWEKHYHKVSTEYNCVISGKVKINGEVYKKNDIFVVKKNCVVDPTFIEDCTIVCIKIPSAKNDKFILKKN
tara:strand:- start:1772 stop:2119 length:348 start_codon:yes stop_codon:yes gene_type:complete